MSLITERPKVLIVDDTPENIRILLGILEDKYDVSIAINGEKALRIAEMEPSLDIILLDIMMPKMDGYEVCAKLKANRKTANIPVIFLTALSGDEYEAKGLELGAADYIAKPFNPALVRARVKNHIEIKNCRDKLEEMVRDKTRELMITRDVAIETLGALAEYRDPETGCHIRRTMHYVRLLAQKLQCQPNFQNLLSNEMVENIWKSAPLHDVGKVGVPDSILLKPDKLTTEEFTEMQKHVIYGRDVLTNSTSKLGSNSFLKIAQEMAYTHHEKWDGSGYPQGLKGEEIPLSGRLMAVADVYDALITSRVYKPAIPHHKAVDIIKDGRGTAFDPVIVDLFLLLEEDFDFIARNFPD